MMATLATCIWRTVHEGNFKRFSRAICIFFAQARTLSVTLAARAEIRLTPSSVVVFVRRVFILNNSACVVAYTKKVLHLKTCLMCFN